MIEIRDAKASDLPSVYRVFLEDELKNEAVLPSISQIPMFLTHELRSGHMVVCEEEGEIAGFATTITRGEVVYLAELFMRSDRQSGGVGKLLLQRVLQGATNGVCTLGSTDPRAMALYIRAGMRPLWPNLWLRRELTTGATPVLENLGVVVEQAIVNDPELIEWDREASKRFRPMAPAIWMGGCRGRSLWGPSRNHECVRVAAIDRAHYVTSSHIVRGHLGHLRYRCDELCLCALGAGWIKGRLGSLMLMATARCRSVR
ncbi:MAG: GNAT family N-acetyltransferase [Thermomicrobiales bacterium]